METTISKKTNVNDLFDDRDTKEYKDIKIKSETLDNSLNQEDLLIYRIKNEL